MRKGHFSLFKHFINPESPGLSQLHSQQTNTGVSTNLLYTEPPPSCRPPPELWTPVSQLAAQWTHVVDTTATGTTLILIATDAYNSYRSLTGGVLDANTGLLKITSTQYANLKTLNFNIHGVCPINLPSNLMLKHIFR